jgi:hypothetical protein
MLVLVTQHNMFTDHVDINQGFLQGDLLTGDDHNGKVYISDPPVYPEDPEVCYLLHKPLHNSVLTQNNERLPQNTRLH